MTANTRKPVGLTSFRQRARSSTEQSTGLDCSSCYRVDEDIDFRIRSLRLSSHAHHPPRTPYPSGEYSVSVDSCEAEPVVAFDFKTAKSVAKLIRIQADKESLTALSRQASVACSTMDREVAPKPLVAKKSITERQNLIGTSSDNDLQALVVDAETHETDLPCSPLDAPAENKPLQLSRFNLNNERTLDHNSIRPSLDGEQQSPDDKGRPKAETDTSPRHCSLSTYDPQASQVEETIDLPDHPCFIAGCSPGPYECKKHRRRSSQIPPAYVHTLNNDISAFAHHIAEDFAGIGHTIKNNTVLSHHKVHPDSGLGIHEPDHKLSATAVNFSIGPESLASEPDSEEPAASLQAKPSNPSMKTTPKVPSLLSHASRKSARHALLKPSISYSSPIDTGLPIPPVLTSVVAKTEGGIVETRPDSSLIPLTGIASDDFIENDILSFTSEPAKPDVQKPLPCTPLDIEAKDVVETTPDGESQLQNSQELVLLIAPPTISTSPSRTDSPDSEYWGYVPSVKEAVIDAVQNAVRRAVHEVVVPTGIHKDQAASAYRKLVGASLAQATVIADDYLRRVSLWDVSATSETQAYLDLPYVPPGETVPLELTKNAVGENFKPGWKITIPWRKDSHAYDAIPTRDSSRKNALKSKLKDANPSAVAALKAVGSRKRSSDGSSDESFNGIASVDPEAGTQHTTAFQHDEWSNKRIPHSPKLVSRNTAHWVRELLSHEGPYEARFTELPPRERRGRSWTAPVKPVDDLFLDEPTRIIDPKSGPPNTESLRNFEDKQTAISDTFTKTIKDLEHLLNEALFIARQATEEEDAPYVPRLLETATAVLRGGLRQESKAKIRSVAYSSQYRSSRASSVASMHESLRSHSSPTGSETDDSADDNAHIPRIRLKTPSEIIISTKTTKSVSSVLWPLPGQNLTPNAPTQPNLRSLQPYLSPIDDTQSIDNNAKERHSSFFSTANVNMEKAEGTHLTHRQHSAPLPVYPSTPRRFSLKAMKSGLQADHERICQGLPPVSNKPQAHSGPLTTGHSGDIEMDSMDLSTIHKSQAHVTRKTYSHSFDGSVPSDALDFEAGYGQKYTSKPVIREKTNRGVELKDTPAHNLPENAGHRHRRVHPSPSIFNLNGRSHVSIKGEHHKGFSLTRSHKRQVIARDWSPARKRFVASVACTSTSLIGLLSGIYAAEVPSIQYYIVDFHHYTILGNVFFFIGLAISTFFSWPLPLLHGRKPYTLSAMCLAMPLLFPQALVVGGFRSPYVSQWRVALLLPRALMGLVLGMASMNFQLTLTDLFGGSLQSKSPHQEIVDNNDVRRHGGGMGMWLGIWTWCQVASGGIGFLIGAVIINSANPAWGFYVSICIVAAVLLLNIVSPEVRRAAFRRSVAEVKTGEQVSHRLARGEVKMHMVQRGPKWWGQEFIHGVKLSGLMLRQSGFLVMAMYVAWIYGQIVLTVVLLGSLMSKYYRFKSPYVGASVTALPIGALLSIPFQKAGLFSRDRSRTISDDDTRNKRVTWSSHLVRRAIFVLVLPFAGLAYTVSSNGPPIPFIIPIIFAGLIGFLSSLAMAECYGIIMETFDVSDLQPGMTGRPRKSGNDKHAHKRTNYSSFPRVSAGFAITQSFGYLIAAAATGVGGVAQRHLGQQAATGVMAGILLVLSVLLLGILIRFREVQIIPDLHKDALQRYMNARRESTIRRGSKFDEDDLRPIIIGNPTDTIRRMCVLELGSLSRWSEIRRKNHLIDQNSLEAKHPNIATLVDLEGRIMSKEKEITESIQRNLSREGSRRSKASKRSSSSQPLESYRLPEQGDLGGHVELGGGNGPGPRRGGSERIGKRRKTTIHETPE